MRDDKFHYDVSKLDQWQIVFDHAQQKGLYLHFKLQETENDDNLRGAARPVSAMSESLSMAAIWVPNGSSTSAS